ncbi:RloB family protein [Candidatus Poriferisocius sp.]|uniref:RloB family protein n=1 Tax=Candidatus Poriferisocius sp. TaxID=3101276 RepID=UPI003B024AF3
MIFTEGEKTEEQYLLPWRREFRDRLLITIDSFHGVPLALVNKAVEAKKSEERNQKRGYDRAHDEIWCMFDIDSHLLFSPTSNVSGASVAFCSSRKQRKLVRLILSMIYIPAAVSVILTGQNPYIQSLC